MAQFDESDGPFCPLCGLPEGQTGPDHTACRAALELEPPRFCPTCRRRMIVQVMPAGWHARCSVHGEIGAD